MAKRRKPARKRSRKAGAKRWSWPSFTLPQINWPSPGRSAIVAAWTLAVAGLVTAWVLGVPRLERYAAEHHAPDAVQVSFGQTPVWVEPSLTETLGDTVAAHIGGDPLRRQDLVDARQSLLATGWVTEVAQVRRVNANRVVVQATFTRPVAVVRDSAAGRDHLIDPQGRLLPRSFTAGEHEYVAITGTQYNRPGKPGDLWPGEDVTAGLLVLQRLLEQEWYGQVEAIDVARHWRDATLRLVTDSGCRITWGRAPGDEGGSEVQADQKIRYLEYHYREYGHIDRGMEALDITGDVVTGR